MAHNVPFSRLCKKVRLKGTELATGKWKKERKVSAVRLCYKPYDIEANARLSFLFLYILVALGTSNFCESESRSHCSYRATQGTSSSQSLTLTGIRWYRSRCMSSQIAITAAGCGYSLFPRCALFSSFSTSTFSFLSPVMTSNLTPDATFLR